MNTFDTHIRNATLAVLVCAFAAAKVWAASAQPDFKAYDRNSDGMISLEEFVELGGKGKDFLAGDSNGDNHLSGEELIKITAIPAPKTEAH
jgi:Ca2+-binding EF-hand superfamily protein